jgi:hypothetical protein
VGARKPKGLIRMSKSAKAIYACGRRILRLSMLVGEEY